MNIIEEFGSYEKAKKHQIERALNGLLHDYDFELVDALLEYRREHGIYEVGDFIIDSLIGNGITRYHDGYRYMDDWYIKSFLKHATALEIAAGHRLP